MSPAATVTIPKNRGVSEVPPGQMEEARISDDQEAEMAALVMKKEGLIHEDPYNELRKDYKKKAVNVIKELDEK